MIQATVPPSQLINIHRKPKSEVELRLIRRKERISKETKKNRLEDKKAKRGTGRQSITQL